MEATYTNEMVTLGIALTELAVKGTATAITSKVKAIQNEKNIEKVRNAYDEIINELLSERDETLRIAQAYKTELEHVVISDDDIRHLHNTVSRVLELIKAIQLSTARLQGGEAVAKVQSQIESYEQLKELISVDTLKTMQLLGFNYKAAIGEPLTQICSNAISSIGQKKGNGNRR